MARSYQVLPDKRECQHDTLPRRRTNQRMEQKKHAGLSLRLALVSLIAFHSELPFFLLHALISTSSPVA